MPRRQPMATSHLGLAGWASAEFAAFLQEFWPGCPVDGPINTAAAKQGLVGGVDDGLDVKLRDIALDDLHPSSNAACHVHAPPPQPNDTFNSAAAKSRCFQIPPDRPLELNRYAGRGRELVGCKSPVSRSSNS
jgi:hypothetical protein